MGKNVYDGSIRFSPLSAWAYVGYSLLFAIPIIGWILLLWFSISWHNINRRNFARSFLCWTLIFVLSIVGLIVYLVNNGFINKDFVERFSLFDPIEENKEALADEIERIAYRLQQLAMSLRLTDSASSTRSITNVSSTASVKPIASIKDDSETSSNSSLASVVVDPEFKKLMNSYEAFFDEYIAFMKKYNSNDGSTTEMFSDYTTYMLKYADMMEKLEAIEDDELNSIDMAYYMQVMARIYQKIGNMN